jgi:Fe-S-cluster containining protein
MNQETRTSCIRCGECCRKSTPSLHPEDIPLIEEGVVRFPDLVTLRVGELVYDNIRDSLFELPEELVKIREKPGSRECLFYDPHASGCRIYEQRPRQCRVLECWKPEELVKVFGDKKIGRINLLVDQGMLDLVAAHEARVSLSYLRGLLDAQREGSDRESEIVDMVNYDIHFREFLSEKLPSITAELLFYFGRPVLECINGFGFEVTGDQEKGFYLVAVKD